MTEPILASREGLLSVVSELRTFRIGLTFKVVCTSLHYINSRPHFCTIGDMHEIHYSQDNVVLINTLTGIRVSDRSVRKMHHQLCQICQLRCDTDQQSTGYELALLYIKIQLVPHKKCSEMARTL